MYEISEHMATMKVSMKHVERYIETYLNNVRLLIHPDPAAVLSKLRCDPVACSGSWLSQANRVR